MSAISGYINTIRNAVYGEQVRTAIINSLEQCYSDVNAPSLQKEGFEEALAEAYAGGILDIQTVTSFNDMTNDKIIYRYNGTAAGKQKGLYYFSALSNSWVLIGSEIQKVSLASQMTDTNDIYKYIGTEAGMVQNSLYCHNGTTWTPVGSGILTASTAAQMTNTDAIYKYIGTEAGYIPNALYYYNGTSWDLVNKGDWDEILKQADFKIYANKTLQVTASYASAISDYNGQSVIMVRIPANAKVRLYFPGIDSSALGSRILNEYGGILDASQLRYTSDANGYTFIAPPTAKYLQFAISSSSISSILVFLKYYNAEAEAYKTNHQLGIRELGKLFDTAIIVGDSLAALEDMPNRLAQLSGWTITNGGVRGLTATTWYEDEISKYDFADYQICFIELGVNGGLTDTLDTDVIPYDNYQNYANTNTGNYCKIIETILEQNPNIFLVLIQSPNFVSQYYASIKYSTALKHIAEHYNLPLIDLLSGKYSVCIPSMFRPNDTAHMTKAGFYLKAEAIFNAFNDVLADNTEKLNQYLTT